MKRILAAVAIFCLSNVASAVDPVALNAEVTGWYRDAGGTNENDAPTLENVNRILQGMDEAVRHRTRANDEDNSVYRAILSDQDVRGRLKNLLRKRGVSADANTVAEVIEVITDAGIMGDLCIVDLNRELSEIQSALKKAVGIVLGEKKIRGYQRVDGTASIIQSTGSAVRVFNSAVRVISSLEDVNPENLSVSIDELNESVNYLNMIRNSIIALQTIPNRDGGPDIIAIAQGELQELRNLKSGMASLLLILSRKLTSLNDQIEDGNRQIEDGNRQIEDYRINITMLTKAMLAFVHAYRVEADNEDEGIKRPFKPEKLYSALKTVMLKPGEDEAVLRPIIDKINTGIAFLFESDKAVLTYYLSHRGDGDENDTVENYRVVIPAPAI